MADRLQENRERFYEALREAGHTLEMDEDGKVNAFALCYGFHNGPRCVTCGEDWCEHCEGVIGKCSGLKDPDHA